MALIMMAKLLNEMTPLAYDTERCRFNLGGLLILLSLRKWHGHPPVPLSLIRLFFSAPMEQSGTHCVC